MGSSCAPRRPSCVRILCLGALIEAVRDRLKTVDLKQVNRVIIQPPSGEQRDQAS